MSLVLGGYQVSQRLVAALARGHICSIESATQALRDVGVAPRNPSPMGKGTMLWQRLHASDAAGQVVLEVSEGPLVTPLHTYPEGGEYGIKILGFYGAVKILLRDGRVHETLSGSFVRALPAEFVHATEVESVFVAILHLPKGVVFCR